MLREYNYIFARVNMAADFAIGVAAVLVAHVIRNEILAPYIFPDIFRSPAKLYDYLWLVLLVPIASVVMLKLNGFYESQRVRTPGSALVSAILASVGASAFAMIVAFVFGGRNSSFHLSQIISAENVSRGVLLLFPIVNTGLIFVKTLIVREYLMSIRKSGWNSRTLLLVGEGNLLTRFIQMVNANPSWGFTISGVVSNCPPPGNVVEGAKIIGSLDHFFPFVENNVIDEVIFLPGHTGWNELEPLLQGCEEMGIRTRFPLDFSTRRIAKPEIEFLSDFSVVSFNPVRSLNWALLVKYAFDRVAASMILLVLAIPMGIIALLIKWDSGSWSAPVFFGQKRCGLRGKVFTLWKFRSMVLDAEAKRKELEAFNEMSGPVFKMKDDPRITRLGRVLRKFSIDELPQLWNVVTGELSLVGPRPPLPSEVEKYDRWQRRRLSMKPGITCSWQVSGRNHISFEQWMKLDLEYIDNWSLGLDLRILFKTVYVVVTGHGAM